MKKEQLLQKYRDRISSVTLDLPGFDALAPPLAPDKGWTLPSLPPALVQTHEVRSVPQPRRRSLWLWLGLASAGIVGAVFWVQSSARPVVMVHAASAIPYNHAMGLAFKDGQLYSVDAKRMLLFAFSTDGTQVTGVSRIENPQLSGLSAGLGGFWSSEAAAGRIHRHNNDSDHTVQKTYTNANSSPAVVYWTGTSLWASDQRSETIYQYSVQNGLIPLRQYSLPGIQPVGLHVAQNVLWLLDAATLEVRRYQVGAMLAPVDSTPLRAWISGQAKVTGFAVEEKRLWIITENPAQLHRFELSGLTWTPLATGGF